MNKTAKQVILTLASFIAPFILFLLLGNGFVASFFIAILVDAFVIAAYFLYHKQIAKVKEVGYEEICDRVTEILFKLKQDGEIIEGVTLGPEFMEIEHKSDENAEVVKSTIPFIVWGVDGKKTYLHASKAAKDFLGKSYSILMLGELIVISKKKDE